MISASVSPAIRSAAASAWAVITFRSASRFAISVWVVCSSRTTPRCAAVIAALLYSWAVRYWASLWAFAVRTVASA